MLPDGRLVYANILLGWDGRFFVPEDDIEEETPLEPHHKLARSLILSGDTKAFDAVVFARFQREAAIRESISGTGGVVGPE